MKSRLFWGGVAIMVLAEAPAIAQQMITISPGERTTIQDAIDSASNGAEIVLLPGTYTGPGNRGVSFQGKAITVRSTDPTNPSVVESTIIDCEELDRAFLFVNGEQADSQLLGLRIINGYIVADNAELVGTVPFVFGTSTNYGFINYGGGGAILCVDSSPTIAYNAIEDCRVHWQTRFGFGGAILCATAPELDASTPLFSHNRFQRNVSSKRGPESSDGYSGYGGAIACFRSSPQIEYNEFLQNRAGPAAPAQVGHMSGHCQDVYLARSFDGAGGAIFLYDGSSAYIFRNQFIGNVVRYCPPGPGFALYATVEGGAVYSHAGGPPLLGDLLSCQTRVVENLFVENSAVVEAGPFGVVASMTAFGGACAGDYAPTPYYPETAPPAFLGNVFDSNVAVVRQPVNSEEVCIAQARGGALYLQPPIEEASARVALRDCVFIGNAAIIDGVRPRYEAQIEASGGALVNGAMIVNCTFEQNWTEVGPFEWPFNNTSFIVSDSRPVVHPVLFAGAMFSQPGAIVHNTYVTHNSAIVHGGHGESAGGGVAVGGSALVGPPITITNCTITDNSATIGGGIVAGINLLPEPIQMTNTIVWGNLGTFGSSIAVSAYSWVDAKYCNIPSKSMFNYYDRNHPGAGGIYTSSAIVTVNPLLSGYKLQCYSPCIDAGDPNFSGNVSVEFLALVAPLVDLDSQARVHPGPPTPARVDIGADEFWYDIYCAE